MFDDPKHVNAKNVPKIWTQAILFHTTVFIINGLISLMKEGGNMSVPVKRLQVNPEAKTRILVLI